MRPMPLSMVRLCPHPTSKRKRNSCRSSWITTYLRLINMSTHQSQPRPLLRQNSLRHHLLHRGSEQPRQPREPLENAVARPPSPSSPPIWTDEDKKMLRTLKTDERSRFSWKVIAGKLGKPEHDVRTMWNHINIRMG